jgi:hypothetical protein
MRRHLCGRSDTLVSGAAQCLHRLPRGQVQQVERLALVGGERKIALDHQALGNRRVAGEPELGGHLAFVHLPVA